MSPTDKHQETSLLERLGGEPAPKAAIEELYFRLLCDEELLVFFEGVNLQLLKVHQQTFLRVALSNNNIEKHFDAGTIIRGAHARLFEKGLCGTHFDLVANHLVESLLSLGIQQDLIDEVVGVVGPLRTIFEENSIKAADAVGSKEKEPIMDAPTTETTLSESGSQHEGRDFDELKVKTKKGNVFSKLFRKVGRRKATSSS